MIKLIMEILFEVLIASFFLPNYKCVNESFLSKVSIKSNGNVTCGVEMLILLLILNKLLKTNKFNSIVISVLIMLFVVSTQQAFSHVRKNTIICLVFKNENNFKIVNFVFLKNKLILKQTRL